MTFLKHNLSTRRHEPGQSIPDQDEFDESIIDLEFIKTRYALLSRKAQIILNKQLMIDRLFDIADFFVTTINEKEEVGGKG